MGHAKPSALAWQKSSRCDSGHCVEVAWRTDGVAVRNNTVPGVQLSFDSASWQQLVQGLRRGRLAR